MSSGCGASTPWSPAPDPALTLTQGDVAQGDRRDSGGVDRRDPARPAAIRDCRRAVLAGVLRRAGARDPAEGPVVSLHRHAEQAHFGPRCAEGSGVQRLQRAGFSTELNGDGVLAVRRSKKPSIAGRLRALRRPRGYSREESVPNALFSHARARIAAAAPPAPAMRRSGRAFSCRPAD